MFIWVFFFLYCVIESMQHSKVKYILGWSEWVYHYCFVRWWMESNMDWWTQKAFFLSSHWVMYYFNPVVLPHLLLVSSRAKFGDLAWVWALRECPLCMHDVFGCHKDGSCFALYPSRQAPGEKEQAPWRAQLITSLGFLSCMKRVPLKIITPDPLTVAT